MQTHRGHPVESIKITCRVVCHKHLYGSNGTSQSHDPQMNKYEDEEKDV